MSHRSSHAHSSRAFLKNILEKLNSHDKDFRYMAVNDFEAKLHSSGFHMEGDSERQVRASLRLLD
jgi:hypothetical protein